MKTHTMTTSQNKILRRPVRTTGKFLLLSLLVISQILTFAFSAKDQFTHTLTIFVDEGKGKLNGHVWIGIGTKDGSIMSYHGFYPEKIVGLPKVFDPGQVRDDSQRVKDDEWDIKRTYNITKEGYKNALAAMNAWQNQDKTHWDVLTHCGDFTEGVAKAAGIDLNLSWSIKGDIKGKTRPAVFGEYLRKHGGIVNANRKSIEGTWSFLPTGETVVIRSNGSGAYSFQLNGINWTVTKGQGAFTGSKQLTQKELLMINPDTPPTAATQAAAAGANAKISLEVEDDSIVLMLHSPAIGYNHRGEFTNFGPSIPLPGILTRKK